MIFLSDIISWICGNIDTTILFTSITDNGDGTYTIKTDDTYSLRIGKIITIDSIDYKVIDFKINCWFKISGTGLDLTTKSITLPTLGYQIGTLFDADKERGIKRKLRKQPLPFLWSRMPYNVNLDWSSLIGEDTEFDVEWYLLDVTNPNDYLVEDDDREVIQPMYNVLERIKKTMIRNNGFIKKITTAIKTTTHKEIGVQESSGNVQRLFEENLSGLKIIFSFTAYNDSCFGNCD